MKKDIFNGKIKPEHATSVFVSMIISCVIYLACAILFLCLGLLYDNVEHAARIVLYVVSGLCFLLTVLFPVATVILVRTYPKYRKLTHVFVKPYFLKQEEQSADDNE